MILGCSADSPRKNCNFAEKHDLGYKLLCDEEHDVLNKYGVWGPKKVMGREFDGIHRATFIIDEEGNVAHVFPKVKVKGHDQAVLDLL